MKIKFPDAVLRRLRKFHMVDGRYRQEAKLSLG